MEPKINSNPSLEFLKSTLASQGVVDTREIINWLKVRNENVAVAITQTDFSTMRDWVFDSSLGNLRHRSGRYFSIDGIHVESTWGDVPVWEQPIVNQPEIGYLGFMTKEFNGVLHFLIQAKIEPGNLNAIQISPTLQATKSNYSQVHKGEKPKYLEYFQNAKPNEILVNQLQSEQGARFLKKRNLNMIIKVDEEVELFEDFKWVTLGQIKDLMRFDNVVNMDTRTVVSGVLFGSIPSSELKVVELLLASKGSNSIELEFLKSALCEKNPVVSTADALSFLATLKSRVELYVRNVPLSRLADWSLKDDVICRADGKFFSVIAVDVMIENREVSNWNQPMIRPAQNGICAFVCKMIDGTLQFAVQAKLECGNHDVFELAPTVQCLTGDYRNPLGPELPFLRHVLDAKPEQIYFDTQQSEEGGRFFHESNRNMIVIADEHEEIVLPSNFIWLTLNQLLGLVRYNNIVNIQARSLISAISFN
jgi:dTDP-4-dehydro-6-deoxy-alpha-D-glucopyranose 2,3-dehydratase